MEEIDLLRENQHHAKDFSKSSTARARFGSSRERRRRWWCRQATAHKVRRASQPTRRGGSLTLSRGVAVGLLYPPGIVRGASDAYGGVPAVGASHG